MTNRKRVCTCASDVDEESELIDEVHADKCSVGNDLRKVVNIIIIHSTEDGDSNHNVAEDSSEVTEQVDREINGNISVVELLLNPAM